MRYAYIFIAIAVVGAFTITGLMGSYTRMLVKTESFNQIRNDLAMTRKNYQQLEKKTQEKDVQVASLGTLASEVSALYGLRDSKVAQAAAVPKSAPAPALQAAPSADDQFTQENYTHSLDQFYALRLSWPRAQLILAWATPARWKIGRRWQRPRPCGRYRAG
jgi:hypothetical protein